MPRAVPAAVACGLLSAVAQAHVVSISSGELRVTGPRSAAYELRMPAYEVEHISDPATALLEQVSFTGARRTSPHCAQAEDAYVCTAQYEFDRDIGDALEVTCTLYRVTAPNHVHMLYAHGLPYAAFPPAYLGGAVAVQAVLIGALAAAALRMPRAWMRPAAAALLVAGVAWFGRLWLD